MGNIIILDESISSKIAAGEVIERPASAVKELVENSIDAGAETISVEIKKGGVSFIKVSDNGRGIEADDVERAFERHSTSKIKSVDDLDYISTFGFRGEALASIASVSTIQMTTRTRNSPLGMYIELHAGKVAEKRQTGCAEGTSIIVKDLFFNTPARYKFLKKDSTEARYVSDIIERIALGNPHISFSLTVNGVNLLHTPGNGDLKSAIFSIYGKETVQGICEINYKDSMVRITGYAGRPEIARASRNHQSIFINRRYVRSKIITSAIDEAYKTMLMKNKYPFIVINVEINPLLVDVNTHPAKMEVRFSNEQEIYRSVYHAVSDAILGKQRVFADTFDDLKNVQNDVDIKSAGKTETPHEYSQMKLYEYSESESESESEIQAAAEAIKAMTINAMTIKEEGSHEGSYHEETAGQELPIARILPHSRLVGQAFSTYIIFQTGEKLVILDQHAAHERIIYEKLKRKFYKGEPLAQSLAAPVVLELSHKELDFLNEHKEIFLNLGFIYEDFGNNSIVLRSIPFLTYEAKDIDVRSLFLDALDTMINFDGTKYSEVADETLYQIACKAAVKANKNMSELEIRALLNDLGNIENPFTCPHGRPITVEIEKHELEKMFKRIV